MTIVQSKPSQNDTKITSEKTREKRYLSFIGRHCKVDLFHLVWINTDFISIFIFQKLCSTQLYLSTQCYYCHRLQLYKLCAHQGRFIIITFCIFLKLEGEKVTNKNYIVFFLSFIFTYAGVCIYIYQFCVFFVQNCITKQYPLNLKDFFWTADLLAMFT